MQSGMANFLRGFYRFHRWLNPEDYGTTLADFRESAYGAGAAAGSLGAGSVFETQVIGTNRIKTTGVANFLANRLRHGIVTSVPMPKRKGTFSGGGSVSKKTKTSHTKRRLRKKSRGKKKANRRNKGTHGGTGVLDRYHSVSQKNTGWSNVDKKFNSLHRMGRKLQILETASGNLCTMVLSNSSSLNQTVAGACATSGFFFLTGQGCTDNNGGDIAKMFAVCKNLAPAGALATIKANKQSLYIKDIHVKIVFGETETGNVDCDYELYECICIQTHSATDTGATLAGLITTCLDRESAPGTHGGNALTSTHIALSPFLLHEFGQYWKVYKIQKGQLNATDTHMFERHYRVNHVFNPDRLISDTYYAGLSRMYFIKGFGSLGLGTSEQAATLNFKIVATYRMTMDDQIIPYVVTSSAAVT